MRLNSSVGGSDQFSYGRPNTDLVRILSIGYSWKGHPANIGLSESGSESSRSIGQDFLRSAGTGKNQPPFCLASQRIQGSPSLSLCRANNAFLADLRSSWVPVLNVPVLEKGYP
ncbi:hypothetical protein ElyMa_006656000 [Elysia marginata]|uniref:Uncharacterized protein n=1 Tax=Elysia marginata TaxID=1093978 RepID=A0AAV4IKU3_9GAST|nr:hypothetical protein ElyMa_006656000 [Elysia marginata]